jgi:hypothetical protein
VSSSLECFFFRRFFSLAILRLLFSETLAVAEEE